MQYCNGKDGQINYKFQGGDLISVFFTKEQSPITVTAGSTRPGDATNNYSPSGYSIEYRNVSNQPRVASQIIDHYVNYVNPNGTPSQFPYLWYRPCAGGAFRWISIRNPHLIYVIPDTGACSPPRRDLCTVTITDKDNNVLANDAGDCDLFFIVKCFGCPPGTLDCDGCCADCKDVNDKLKILNELIGKITL